MTQEEMAFLQNQIFEECKLLRKAGQKEYAHTDAFRNFRTLGQELNLSQEKVLWIYFRKHIDGILAYLNGHKSQRENVRGRINDAIVYLCLLRGMVDDRDIVTSSVEKVQYDAKVGGMESEGTKSSSSYFNRTNTSTS